MATEFELPCPRATCHARADIVAACMREREPFVVISIATPHAPGFPGTESRSQFDNWVPPVLMLHRLDLNFDDFDRIPMGSSAMIMGRPPVMFTDEHAEVIAAFVREYEDVGRILVHCDAGVSRSAAVAAAIAKHYTGDDFWFFNQKSPNRRVYRAVLYALRAP